MIHSDTEVKFISPEKGYGVVATKLIPKGTITWALDKLDRLFTPEQLGKFHGKYYELLITYCYRDRKGNFILCWDNGRFVNHSFNSSCITTCYDFELAVKDIQPGEEITDDYGYLNMMEPFKCLPEEGSNRRMVMPDDLLHYHKEWDTKLISAFQYLNKVDQPLKNILTKEIWEKASRIAEGKEKMDSILNCYFDPAKVNGKIKQNGHIKELVH